MEHPYLYDEWVEDAIEDLWVMGQLSISARHNLECGKAVPQAWLDRMAGLAEKLQRQFDPKLAEYGNGQA